ncbi:hypothetical protein PsorP6_009832 [Peronosclerospora sorghi]|uniref:Uncharacterized protein n=1 Tax=Peronosclerospora sorghi TaxID=230839 RepID=A0ACC0VYN6_9STRA|nr:hypothetical protein PsorP6_009832 [Peronosclerospora sorghi]
MTFCRDVFATYEPLIDASSGNWFCEIPSFEWEESDIDRSATRPKPCSPVDFSSAANELEHHACVRHKICEVSLEDRS